MSTMAMTALIATYKAPGSSYTFSLKSSPRPEAGNVQAKTAYLSSLRSNIVQMQSDVNAFLTMKMDESRTTETEKVSASKAKEKLEEDMYGEEDPEADG